MIKANSKSHQGWADYASGLPYPVAYDTWREVDQRNYENGRMRAANYQLAIKGGKLPKQQPSLQRYNTMIAVVGAAFRSKNEINNMPKNAAKRSTSNHLINRLYTATC